MWNTILGIFRKKQQPTERDVMTALCRLFGGHCVVCSKELGGHLFELIGQVKVQKTPGRFEEVKARFRQGPPWMALENSDGFRADSDYAQIFAVKCDAVASVVSLFLIATYYDLNVDDEVLDVRTLNASELSEVARHADWKRL